LTPENYLIKNFHFLLINRVENKTNSSGMLGLNLKPVNENNNNFISQLYETGHITSQKFSIYFSEKMSKIFLGDYSEGTTISSIYRLMSYCKVADKANNWECDLNSIDINKFSINSGSKLKIDTGIDELVVPLIDYKIVKKQLMDSVKSECIRNEKNKLSCKCDNPNIFPNLVLYISNNPFVISLKDLIEFNSKASYQCNFNILIDLENEDTWVLGKSVLTNTLMSFDQSKRKIGFIQNPKGLESLLNGNIIIYANDQNDSKIGFIFFLVFLLVLVFGLFKCANNEKFFSRKSLNPDDQEDRMKIELIKNRFNTEEYDYDDMKPKGKENKYVEMKEVATN
jgi:hypothetical protein